MSAATDAAHTDSRRAPYTSWRILVPLDETAQARRTLVYAQALAAASHGELKLLRASGIEAEAGLDSLANYAAHIRQTGVAVHWTVVKDQTAESAILEAARSWRPDLITLATRKWSGVDRWLSGSVTDTIIKSASAPILVVPPNWERPFGRNLTLPSLPAKEPSTVVRYAPDWPQPLAPERPARILVPLDGSRTAEQALVPSVRLAHLIPAQLVLLRVTGATDTGQDGVEEYMRRMAANVTSAVPGQHVTSRVAPGNAVAAILETACEFDVDAIAMSTRGLGGAARVVLGSTATAVLERSSVPLLLVGPNAHVPATAQIQIRARVRTLDERVVGEVHRVVVDFEQQAIVSVVVLGRGPLARDVLVPFDFVQLVTGEELLLRLTSDELDQLPDFTYNDFVTPPPETWTAFVPAPDAPMLIPVSERRRLGSAQHEITPGTRVCAEGGDIGAVNRVEADETGRLVALWVRAGGIFATDVRIPSEWIRRTDVNGNLLVAVARADIEAYLGHEFSGRRTSLEPSPPYGWSRQQRG